MLIALLLISCGASTLSVDPTATPTLPRQTPTLIAGLYTYDDLIHVFDYDPQAPLNIQEVSVSTELNLP
jgi:hypothetical protein